jgi:hypothetical protein
MAPSNPGFSMPSGNELDQLLNIALNALPVLRPPRFDRFGNDLGLGDLGTEFKTAYWALGALVRRADKPDVGKATSWWLAHVNEQLRIAGRHMVAVIRRATYGARCSGAVVSGRRTNCPPTTTSGRWRLVVGSGRADAFAPVK